MNGSVTRALEAIDSGDPTVAAALLPLVYDELRALAHARLAKESPGKSLQATALVHEVYLRLIGPGGPNDLQWNGRPHFFGAAAEAMRRILIDHARARGAAKRGGGHAVHSDRDLDDLPLSLDGMSGDLLDLDAALTAFAAEEPAKAELVRLRFYAGLTLEQAGRVLGLSPATADRHWAYARAWLFSRLSK